MRGQLNKIVVPPGAGLGLVHEGLDIPDDLVEVARERGAVIARYEDVLAASIPADELEGPAVMPSSTGPGWMVITQEQAEQYGIPIFYDPILGRTRAGNGAPRRAMRWGVVLGGAAVAAFGIWYLTSR